MKTQVRFLPLHLLLAALIWGCSGDNLDKVLVASTGTWKVTKEKLTIYEDGILTGENTLPDRGTYTFDKENTGQGTFEYSGQTQEILWDFDEEAGTILITYLADNSEELYTIDQEVSDKKFQKWTEETFNIILGIEFHTITILELDRQ